MLQVPEDHYFEYSEINTHTQTHRHTHPPTHPDAGVKKGRGKLLISVIDFLCVQFYLKSMVYQPLWGWALRPIKSFGP